MKAWSALCTKSCKLMWNRSWVYNFPRKVRNLIKKKLILVLQGFYNRRSENYSHIYVFSNYRGFCFLLHLCGAIVIKSSAIVKYIYVRRILSPFSLVKPKLIFFLLNFFLLNLYIQTWKLMWNHGKL